MNFKLFVARQIHKFLQHTELMTENMRSPKTIGLAWVARTLMNIREFLFTHTESFTFFCVVDAKSDEDMEAGMNIARASGTWTNLYWSRAFDSLEHMKIYEKAKDGMASYVTTMQVAETS